MENERIVDDTILEDAQFEAAVREADRKALAIINTDSEPTQPTESKKDTETFTQWALGGNGRFIPVGTSINNLEPGIYEPFSTPGSWGLERMQVSSDEIYELPEMATNTVLAEAETFWNNEEKYRRHNLLYKRGILLHGPPGSGKTVTIKLLIKKLIARGGIVIIVQNTHLAGMCLKAVKRIEPNRNLICIFEDIDEILRSNGESQVLSMLDGEHNVDRVMNIATTNYPDLLGSRIINRPSRFDRRMYIGMPSSDARAHYLQKATNGELAKDHLLRWVADTDKLSIAHLRELVAAVYCLEQPYDEVIKRLQEMATQVKVEDEFRKNKLGFTSTKRNSPRDSDW